jgi:ribulose-phosphate 3-epimerase
VTVHIEAVAEPAGLLRQIRAAGAMSGLAINPKTPAEFVAPYLSECDLLLVMSVEPGFGGQSFMPSVLPKLQQLAQMAPEETLLSIDGGIGANTIASAARAGAELFVVGSALLGADDYTQAVRELRRLAEKSATPTDGQAALVGARD